MSVRFRIVQCLCPARHAILAMAVQDEMPDEEVLALIHTAVKEALAGRGEPLGLPNFIPPWCGICGAKTSTWRYEVAWSRPFADWDEAQRELRVNEADNVATKAILDLLGESYDAKMRAADKKKH